MSLIVRFARPEEYEAVAAIHGAAMRAMSVTRFSPQDVNRVVVERCNPQRWSELFRERNTRCAVAGNVPVGFVQYELSEIIRIFVLPEHWGTGIGKALMEFALADLKSLGAQEAFLWSASTPQALRFYDKCEFTKTGREKQLELVDGLVVTNHEFARKL